jgi:hypothetical protein
MPRTLNEIIAALPESERAKIKARAQELIAEEMSLQDLRRRACTLSQHEKCMKMGESGFLAIVARLPGSHRTLRNLL